jgi:hypothetical protein
MSNSTGWKSEVSHGNLTTRGAINGENQEIPKPSGRSPVTKRTEFRFTDFYPAFIGSSPCSIEEHFTTCTSLHIFASSNSNKK